MRASARPSWTDRAEQLDAGFREVSCRSCAVLVRVRKMSPQQTSVQWSTPTSVCPFLAPDRSGVPGERCPELRASIDDAVVAGLVPDEPTDT